MYVRAMPETYTHLLTPDWPRADLTIGHGTWNADRFEFEDGDTSFVLSLPVLVGSPAPWTDERTDDALGQWLHGPAGTPTVTSASLRPDSDEITAAHRQTLTVTFSADREEFRAFAGVPLRTLVESALEAIGKAWAEDQKTVDRLRDDIRGEAIAW